MDDLKSIILAQTKEAMKTKNKDALGALRLLTGAIKQFEVDNRVDVTDADVMSIVIKQVKQHKESIVQFKEAGRSDLVENEESQLSVIEAFMPVQLTEIEIITEVERAINESSASSMADMGKVMGMLKAKLLGRANMSVVSNILKSKLN